MGEVTNYISLSLSESLSENFGLSDR